MKKLKKTKKLFIGVYFLLSLVVAGGLLIFFIGDINISTTLRGLAEENADLMTVSRYLTNYGNRLYHLLFLSFIFYGVIKKKKKFIRITLIYIVVQIIATGVITEGLKFVVGRPRPRAVQKYGFEHRFFTTRTSFKSFPSGHTSDAFSSAGVLWFFLSSKFLIISCTIYSLLIGLSRIFIGGHYFLDVIVGIVIGFLTALVITKKICNFQFDRL